MRDIKDAAFKTIITMFHGNWDQTDGITGLNKEHIVDILVNVAEGKIEGDKAHRHLGWAQAVCTMVECGTLEDYKDINRSPKEVEVEVSDVFPFGEEEDTFDFEEVMPDLLEGFDTVLCVTVGELARAISGISSDAIIWNLETHTRGIAVTPGSGLTLLVSD